MEKSIKLKHLQRNSKFHRKMFVVFPALLLLLLLQSVLVQTKPIVEYSAKHHKHHNSESAVSDDNLYSYLMEFDYLPKSDFETGALRTEEQFKDAIRNLQRFGNIPVTGELDKETKKLIKRPRCGVGDSKQTLSFSPDNLHHGRMKRYVLQGPKWDKTDLTWSLVNQSMPNAGEVRHTLRKALNVWQNSSKLTFREVYSDQADIQVLFAKRDHGDGYKFDGPGLVLAHAFYPGVGRGGDAHFDDDENWSYDSEPNFEDAVIGTDFLGVAVHEFGHSLGLGHSSDQNAIMFPWYQGYTVGSELPNDDRTAIQELYGAKVKTWASYRPPPRPTTTTTTTTTTTPRIYYPIRNYPNSNPNYNPYQTQRPTVDSRHYYHNNHNNHNGHNYPTHHNPRYDHTPRTYYPDHRTPPTTTRRPYITTTTTTTTRRPRTQPTQRYNPPQRTPTKPHRPPKPRKQKPDSCLTHYDAISMIRGELFIFRGQYLWRIGERGLYPGYPTETKRLWTALPSNFSKIDAVYENHRRRIVFFIGRKFYEFDSVTLVREDYLTALGLPGTLPNIDAAFIWGHNNRTYLFSGTLYWSLDRETGRAELDYPRDLSIWAGIGYNIDAAFQYTNHKTYFFKGHSYWEFNDNLMRVAHPKPKSSARDWMKCPRNANEVDEEQRTAPLISEVDNDDDDDSNSSPSNMRGSRVLLIITGFLTLIFSNRILRSWVC